MARHVFVDEAKSRDYLLVACTVESGEVAAARRTLRDLVMPGQRRLHMKKERNSRRESILRTVESIVSSATIFNAGRSGGELARRDACLRALAEEVRACGYQRLVIERDDSLVRWERRRLVELSRTTIRSAKVSYVHLRPEEEMLLALPDAIAWAWARGGHWRQSVGRFGREVRVVP